MRWAVSLAVVLGIAVLLWSSLRGGRDGSAAAPSTDGDRGSAPALVLAAPSTAAERAPFGSEPEVATHLGDQGEGLRITGRVLCTDASSIKGPRAPAADLEIEVALEWTDGTNGSQYEKTRCTSDAEGRFSATLAEAGHRPAHVRFSVAGNDEYEGLKETHAIPAGRAALEVELLRRRRLLEGRTVEPDGSPVPGVVLTLNPDSDSERVVTTDATGWFRLDRYSNSTWNYWDIEAEHPTHVLLRIPDAVRGPEGWLREVVLVPRGELVVRVRDQEGSPVHGVPIGLGFGRRATTDDDGAARFPAVPADLALRLSFDLSDNFLTHSGSAHPVHLTASSRTQDEVLFAPRAGDPIVVEQGSVLELHATLAQANVRGRVVYPSGEPVPHPYVRLQDADLTGSNGRSWSDIRGDVYGSFSTHLVREPLTMIRVMAIDESGTMEGGFGMAGVSLSIEQLGRGETLTLTVQPPLCISGRVTDSDGVPLEEGVVLAVPAGRPFPHEQIHPSFPKGGEVSSGDFSVRVPGEGRYDLWYDGQRFDSFPAGAHDVRLVIDPARVRVVIRTALATPIDAQYLIVGRHWSRNRERGVATASEEIHVRQSDWPSGQPLDPPHHGYPEDDEEELRTFSFSETRSGTEIVLSLREGWYTIGLSGQLGYAPMATGRIWLGPGEHTIVFHPRQNAKITGTIRPRRPDLGLLLVGEDGRPIPLRTLWETVETLVRVDMLGRFSLDAPVGEYTLRVGRDEDLLRGVFELEVPVSIHAGENPPLALVLR